MTVDVDWVVVVLVVLEMESRPTALPPMLV